MQNSSIIRILLAEDHLIVRQGLRALLESQEDFQIVGEASNGREAVEAAKELKPDVMVMDLGMPLLNGVDATLSIRKTNPNIQVLVLSMYASEEYVRPAIRAGAKGYLLKGSGLSELSTAIRNVAKGENFYSPPVKALLDRDALEPKKEKAKAQQGTLTKREREILQMVAEGYSSPQIARLLKISPKTVDGHRGRLMQKLNIHDIPGLVRYAIRIGLISIEN